MKFFDSVPFIRFAQTVPMRTGRSLSSHDNRLFCCTEGIGTVTVNGTLYSFGAGTVMLWQAGYEYRFDSCEPLKMISVNFDYTGERSDIREPLPMIDVLNDPYRPTPIVFDDCPLLNVPFITVCPPVAHELIDKLIQEFSSRKLYYAERASALLKECIIELLRGNAIDKRGTDAIKTVVSYIHTHFAENIDNTCLASLVGYHPYYLNKLFVAANGVTLHRYVINYRLSVAEQLLLTSNDTVSEIAARTGFASVLNFATDFKKKNRISPSEFRKRIIGEI